MRVLAQTSDGPVVLNVSALLITSDDGTPFMAATDIDGATLTCAAGEPSFPEVCRFAGLQGPDVRQIRK